jgi:23S rRNA (guanosine2251-2'-O)-methyltransferase
MPKPKYIQIESKNAILELLREGRHFERIYLASNAYKDEKTKEIVKIAGQRKIEVLKVSRRILSRRLRTSSSESVIGYMLSENHWKLNDLLDKLSEEGKQPFFLILDNLKYTQNIAAIMRTAFGAGVNGIIVNPQERSLVSNETIRISMGAAERIPLVEIGLFEAVKVLKKEDIKVYGVHMDGATYFETDLTGPIALVLGAEDVGISHGILDKIDGTISIPMREGIGSLNVSASGAILAYEKLRQEVASSK